MTKKEDKAYEYSKKVSNGNPNIKDFTECAFMVGWDCALQNQWIPVEEELPKVGVKVLVLTHNGKTLVTFRYTPKDIYGKILGETEWNGSSNLGKNIIAWMYIPSFDKFLTK